MRSVVPPLIVLAILTAACGGAATEADSPAAGGSEPGAASQTTGPSSSAVASPEALIDLDIDACALLDVATVEQLTGASTRFTSGGSSSASGADCFWGSVEPGVPQYVEVRIFRQRSLSAYSYGDGCTVTPVAGVGVEASLVECPANPQVKTSLLAFERGVIVQVLVNEPASPLTADDLGPVVDSVFDQLP